MGRNALAGARWLGWTALAAALGLLAAIYLRDAGPIERRVLARLPPGQALVAYAEMDALRRSPLVGALVRAQVFEGAGLTLLEREIDAAAVSLGAESVTTVAAGRLPAAAIEAYLRQRGAACSAPIDEAACAVAAPGGAGYLSVRVLDKGLIGLVNGPDRAGADALAADGEAAALAADARRALDDGWLVWIFVEPRRLNAAMAQPPPGWTNLSLAARALLGAREAVVRIGEDERGAAARVQIEARCEDDEAAAELEAVLGGLNRLAQATLGERSEWREVADSFRTRREDKNVVADWSIPAETLRAAARR